MIVLKSLICCFLILSRNSREFHGLAAQKNVEERFKQKHLIENQNLRKKLCHIEKSLLLIALC